MAEETQASNETSLVSLSMLIVNAQDKHEDYLDYLTPFLVEIMRSFGPGAANRQSVHDLLLSRFGLNVPVQAVELCLKRLSKKKLLKSSRLYGGTTYAPSGELSPTHMDDVRLACLDNLKNVLESLITYAGEGHQVIWTEEEAINGLTGYLSNYGIDSLRAYFGKSAIPVLNSSKSQTYVVNSFIRDAQDTNPALFEQIVQLVEGQMLANALLCPDLSANKDSFSGLTVFLDTPLVIRYLDLDGESQYLVAKETFDLCKSLGSRVAVFSHTATEVYSVIKACAMHLDDPNQKGLLIREMRRRNVPAAELLLLAESLDVCFANLGIECIETPKHDPDFQIDEKILDTSLEEDINYLNPRARQYDTDSIRAIYTLRAGKRPKTIEGSAAVLVTTNAALARSAYWFGQKFESSREVSTVVSSFSLANIAWLKCRRLSSDLPKLEMMALAYAALRPSNALWDKYIMKANEMRRRGYGKPADHAILRYSTVVQNSLMNLTLGDEEQLTDRTIQEIIEEAEAELVREERDLRTKQSLQHEEILRAKASEISLLQQEQERLIQTITAAIAARRTNLRNAEMFAGRLGSYLRWISLALSVVLYVLLGYGVNDLLSSSPLWKHIFNVIFGLISTLLTISGATPNGWSKKLGDAAKRWAVRWMEQRYVSPFPEANQLLEAGMSTLRVAILAPSIEPNKTLVAASHDQSDDQVPS